MKTIFNITLFGAFLILALNTYIFHTEPSILLYCLLDLIYVAVPLLFFLRFKSLDVCEKTTEGWLTLAVLTLHALLVVGLVVTGQIGEENPLWDYVNASALLVYPWLLFRESPEASCCS